MISSVCAFTFCLLLVCVSTYEAKAVISSSTTAHEPHLYDYVDPTPPPITLMEVMAMMQYVDDMFNNTCSKDLLTVFTALSSSNPKTWAIKMLDSFGKPDSGLLQGSGQWPGSYHQCRNAVQGSKVLWPPFRGKYCWTYFDVKPRLAKAVTTSKVPLTLNKLSLKTAICVPDTCIDVQIMKIIKLLTEIFPTLWLNDYVNLTEVKCLTDHVIWEDRGDTIVLIVVCVIVFCVLVGTSYDLWQRHTSPKNQDESELAAQKAQNKLGVVLMSISAYSNGKKLLSLDGGRQCLPAVNAIRVISMIWIISGHTLLVSLMTIDNVKTYFEDCRTYRMTMIFQGVLAVDSFFFLSGVLVAYAYLNEYDRKAGRISWLKYYLHRYWRLTPTYLLMIWVVYAGIGKYLGEGPFWLRPFNEAATCKKYWWANILYINNFMPDDAQCMTHSWYLANDMQFYILSPLFLIPFTKSVRWSVFTAFLVIAASSGLFGLIGTNNDFPLSGDLLIAPPGSDKYNDSFRILYSKPYTRISPYIIGLLVGWLIQRAKTITIPKGLAIVGWMVSMATLFTIVFIVKETDNMSMVAKALYHTFARVIWSFVLAWIVIACCAGSGGVVNSIFSWPIWNPLSRLTFCTFLWHPAAIFSMLATTEVTTHYTFKLLCINILANVVYSFSGAIIFSLLLEAPFVGLESLLLKGNNNYKRLSKEIDRNV